MATFIPSNLMDFFVFAGECALIMAGPLKKKLFIYLSEDSKQNAVLKIEWTEPAAGLNIQKIINLFEDSETWAFYLREMSIVMFLSPTGLQDEKLGFSLKVRIVSTVYN